MQQTEQSLKQSIALWLDFSQVGTNIEGKAPIGYPRPSLRSVIDMTSAKRLQKMYYVPQSPTWKSAMVQVAVGIGIWPHESDRGRSLRAPKAEKMAGLCLFSAAYAVLQSISSSESLELEVNMQYALEELPNQSGHHPSAWGRGRSWPKCGEARVHSFGGISASYASSRTN